MTNDEGTFRQYLHDEDKRRDLIEFIRATFRDLATFADAMDTVLGEVCRYLSAEGALLPAWDNRQHVFRPFHASQRDDGVQAPLPPRDGRLAQMATNADQWRPICLLAPELLQQEFAGTATESAVCAPLCLGGRAQAILCLIDVKGLSEENSGLNGIAAEIANALREEIGLSLGGLGLSSSKRVSGEYSLADLFRRGTKWVGVAFADLRGFSRLSELLTLRTGFAEDRRGSRLALPSAAELLNQFRERMVQAMCGHGRVDKFVGDSVMGIIGDLYEEPEEAAAPLKSVCTATRLYDAFGDLLKEWGDAESGWLPRFRRYFSEHIDPRVGIGVHYGPGTFDFYGSPDYQEYSLIGDAVNTAKRVEEHASKLDEAGEECEPVLISQPVFVAGEPCIAEARRHLLPFRGTGQQLVAYGVVKFDRNKCKQEGAKCADCRGGMWTASARGGGQPIATPESAGDC